MKGHVSRRGKTWAFWFDIDPDPLTGRRRQQTRSGFKSEKEAWKECRTAIADYERGRPVAASRRKVAAALDEWLTRIEHSIKPSMTQNWRNYAAYYVIPFIGQRDVQEIDGTVCDALYAKLLSEGRVKARPKKQPTTRAVHIRRLGPGGQALPCRPYSYDTVRCFRTHAEDDPATGQPITPKKLGQRAAEGAAESARRRLSPGLEPKTVVNTHRMLHRAGEDFTTWDGPSATSSVTRTRRECRVRAAKSGPWHSFRSSCSAPDQIGSSRCGSSKPPRACGAASWRARA